MLEVPDVDFIRPCGVTLFLLCFIAAWTCVVVGVMLVVCSLSVFISMCLFVLCVLCLTVLVNCLLNAFAICVGEVNVFSLKVIELFFVFFVVFLLIRVLSSKEYVLCLWSQCVSRCYLHMPDLCVCMRDVISEFSCVLCSDVVSVFYFVSYVFWK